MSNQETFEARDIVRSYSAENELQKPEQTILEMFRDRLKTMRVLDIGVGAGRTTRYFAPVAGHYMAIDYSHNMIEACKEKYPELAMRGAFKVCDARSMTAFAEDDFDFVLFSYNGLDYVSHDDRLEALREIRRIGKKGGYFCFSSHNLNTVLGDAFKISFTLDPLRLSYRVGRRLLFKCLTMNFQKNREKADYLIINDGAHRFRSRTYYVRPEEQIRQLSDLGFGDIRVFDLSEGKELADRAALNANQDSWLYYLCRI
jgi:ubiquinone/menaquinone biosynthesis C-methylase UbiE